MRYKIFIKKTDRRHFAEEKNRQSVSLFVVSILSFLFRLGFWSQEATRSSKPYVKLMFTSKQLSMCVCVRICCFRIWPSCSHQTAAVATAHVILCAFSSVKCLCACKAVSTLIIRCLKWYYTSMRMDFSLSRITRTEVTAIRRSLLAIPFMVT